MIVLFKYEQKGMGGRKKEAGRQGGIRTTQCEKQAVPPGKDGGESAIDKTGMWETRLERGGGRSPANGERGKIKLLKKRTALGQ